MCKSQAVSKPQNTVGSFVQKTPGDFAVCATKEV